MEDTLNARIKRETRRIVKEFKNVPKEKMSMVQSLVERAAFMVVSLEDMEQIINEDGKVVSMPQGSYKIERAHPLLSNYNSMIKNYAAVIRQLCDQMNGEEKQKAGEALMAFAASPKAWKK